MANTLTGLAEFIYETVDNVSNEPAGLIDAVYINGAAEQAALNQDITYDVTAVGTARNITPAATPPAFVDETTAAGTMKLTKSRSVPFYWSGDDVAKLGRSKAAIQNNKIAQALRTLRNEIEADLAALHALTSRAYAAHATTPAALFGTNFGEAAQVRKILVDNGAPMADVSLVLGTTAGAAVRTLIGPTATQGNVENGQLVNMFGMALRESGQIVTTTAVGNNTGTYAINGAHAKGATTLTIKTGTGTILAGDVITIGTDTATKYVVTTGVDNGTSIVIGAPGLKKALSGNEAIAIVGVCERNMCFSRTAIHLLARLPAQPEGGDAATDELIVQDPITGLPFRFAQYKGYHANQYEVGIAWGVKNAAPQHTALLLGN
ncbi:MAG: P22 coat - protein 5 family protein [Deltaproteobacteria bacterium]|nr:MAG: P22 coat - protein 5 family protein [Deltaproteobacteria bacterium]